MKKRIRVLIVEDVENDLELILMRLRENYDVHWKRVETASEMEDALKSQTWDIILSDFSLPQFNAPNALKVLKKTDLDIPFILVSGTIGEERAVSMMKSGATDFVLKDDLIRLVPTVEREFRDAENRRAMSEMSRRYELIVETASEGIWLVDQNALTTFVNPSLAGILGYDRSELIGRSPYEFVDQEHRGEIRQKFQNRSLGVSEQFDCMFRQKNGSELWAIVSSAPIIGSNAEFLGAIAMITDVTERRRAEEERNELFKQLQEALRIRDEFLSIASHELKTPMTPMKINLQSMERILAQDPKDFPFRERLIKLMGGVSREFERLVHLVDELLDVARIRTGRMTLIPNEMNLSAVVQSVVERFREQLKRMGCSLTLVIQPGISMVGDSLRIEEVVVNLLSNAIKFGPGKPIRVSLSTEGASIFLKVQDFGIGISHEDQERIFNRFERAVPERNYGGLGLGLYIVKQILDGHHGSVRVESEPGFGSTFIVELPSQLSNKASA